MAPPTRRRCWNYVLPIVLLVASTKWTTDAFITHAVAKSCKLRAHVPRPTSARPLSMTGGPRGRTQGVNIEGSDGTRAVVTSSTTSPIQSFQDYTDDELIDGGTTGADEGMEDTRGFTVASPGEREYVRDSRSETLSRKNAFLLNAAVAATIGAGIWVTGSAVVRRQDSLVEAYAEEMTYHVGNEEEMRLCHNEFKMKIGPKLYRQTMFKKYMMMLCQKKAISIESVKAVKYVIKLFRFGKIKVIKLLVATARSTSKTQSNVRSKLLFLGTLISDRDQKALSLLEPLRKNMEEAYYKNGKEMLDISMKDMAESALKNAMEMLPDDQALESGWEELGISDERAAEIAEEMTEDEALTFKDFYKTGGPGTNTEETDPEAAELLKNFEEDMKEKADEPQDEKDPDQEGTAKSYECQVCGYKMFVAKGREFKFFGDNFKCPECGAGKSKFTEGDA